MNAKTAKRLRKEARYHPSMKRTYREIVYKRPVNYIKGGKVVRTEMKEMVTKVLDDSDPRTLYKELKKEYKENERSN